MAPSNVHFHPKSPDQNSEIAILFTVVEKPNNYVFGDDLYPRSPRGRGCKLRTLTCVLHIVTLNGKCTDVFGGIFFGLGGRVEVWGGVTWEDISMEKLLKGEENFNEGGTGFSSIY